MQTATIDLNKTHIDFKTKEPIKMLSFQMNLARVMDRCLSRISAANQPKDNSPEEQAKLTLPLITFQNLLIDCTNEGITDATPKEVFYIALTKMTDSNLALGFKILNKLSDSHAMFTIHECRALLKAVNKLRAVGAPNDEINIFAKMFVVNELHEAILSINPGEVFEEEEKNGK